MDYPFTQKTRWRQTQTNRNHGIHHISRKITLPNGIINYRERCFLRIAAGSTLLTKTTDGDSWESWQNTKNRKINRCEVLQRLWRDDMTLVHWIVVHNWSKQPLFRNVGGNREFYITSVIRTAKHSFILRYSEIDVSKLKHWDSNLGCKHSFMQIHIERENAATRVDGSEWWATSGSGSSAPEQHPDEPLWLRNSAVNPIFKIFHCFWLPTQLI